MIDVSGYLRRLGLDHPGPPTVEGLAALQRAHVERIAYTTVDIQRGRPPSIDPAESAARIVATGRGGYCFHLNGAMSLLLVALGYEVRRHRAWVWKSPNEARSNGYPNHLALTVLGQPSEANPGGRWLVDAGLGDALYDPMPLRSGPMIQGGFGYALRPSPVLTGGWRFRHDWRGSFGGVEFSPESAALADFDAAHADLSTSPTSGFVQRLTAQRRHADGYDKLINCTLRRTTPAGTVDEELTTPDQLRAVLADEFALPLDDYDPAEWDTVWQRARAGQDEFLAVS